LVYLPPLIQVSCNTGKIMTNPNETTISEVPPITDKLVLQRVAVNVNESGISQAAREVVQILQKAGHEAYLVGGCIRDLLIDILPKDFDVATSAEPEVVKELFRRCRLIGRRFRLAHVFIKGELIEVATFRKNSIQAPNMEHEPKNKPTLDKPTFESSSPENSKSDQISPKETIADKTIADKIESKVHTSSMGILINDNVFGNLEEDIIRRDFTINALYFDPSKGEVIDGVNALNDLKNKQINMIGDPESRFREDPVRILRALRFAAKLNFEIAPDTKAAIPKLAPLLKEIPTARLFEEFQKLFICGHSQRSFEQLLKWDILKYLLPQTNEYLDQPQFVKMIELALENTSRRIMEGKTVTPSFLLAIFLWAPVRAWQMYWIDKGMPRMLALHRSVQQVTFIQAKSTALPRRFTTPMQDIFELQERLCRATRKNSLKTLAHRRFRAAFDFLVIRENAQDLEKGVGQWWLQFQTCNEEARQDMISCLRTGQARRRK